MPNKIQKITAREILASDGNPTIEATISLANGIQGCASVPFGVSAGEHEAVTLVDGDAKRFNGRGMLQACRNIESTINQRLTGWDAINQKKIDNLLIKLDGTKNKSRLGGNSLLAVSLACARAGAQVLQLPLYKYLRKIYSIKSNKYILPKPMMVVIEGGRHADNSTDFQEYLLTVNGARTVREAVRWGAETYQALKNILKSQSLSVNVGNEGAFAPAGIKTNEEPLSLMVSAIKKAGYLPGKHISISLDPAASEFYEKKDKQYVLKREQAGLSSSQMAALYRDWLLRYPILSIEDGLAEDDWTGWADLYKSCGKKVRIIGDDLTVTNPERLRLAIAKKVINGVLIKLNQIGTLTETMETVQLGQKQNYWQVVSHRGGGETTDTFMVDLAVAVNAEYIKVGPARGERTVKYNRLMEIEDELQKK